ncbi:MAG: hypothetical protein BWY64_03299 [bacterium ADurb.Bin363]|nr:MAG: hypothetical protein BWY64_03299 [bacterium ADurb.Bin363]
MMKHINLIATFVLSWPVRVLKFKFTLPAVMIIFIQTPGQVIIMGC